MGKFLTRPRESVAVSAEPQLQRGGSTEIEESVSAAERHNDTNSGDAFPDGSFPITTQKQADDAWDLRGQDENHSEASIVAHIRRQIAKHGLTMPGSKTRESNQPEHVALAVRLREAKVEKNGGAYEVTILVEGPGNAGDANYYTKQALKEAVRTGKFEGLQAYLNHPTPTEERERPERDVRYLAGHFREARYVDGQHGEVRAKFIPGGMDKDRVVSLIESALESPADKPLVGISIDGDGVVDPQPQTVNGRAYHMVREIASLGSADIVTRAGAGGKFRRRLQEAWRAKTGSASRRPETSKEANMNPAKLQENVRAALAKLSEAAGLKDDDEKAGTLIEESMTALRECASVTIELPEPEVKTVIREVEKPVAAGDSKADELAAELETTRTKLTEAETARDAAKAAEKDAKDELGTVQSGLLARKVMREANVPAKSAEAWFDQVVATGDEDAMKAFVTRKLAERAELLSELQDELGVEGAGPRQPLRESTAPATGDAALLANLGLTDLAA